MEVSSNLRTLTKDNKHFFYLADTCWSAFTNIEDSEWDYYLSLRKRQGFNTLQINILPQWDASKAISVHSPFVLNEEGAIDYTQLNEAYFKHARSMSLKAKEVGFELALVVLWCNYVPDTWASTMSKNKMVVPFEFIEMYTKMVATYFKDITSLFMISGDTDFSEVSTPYYLEAARHIKTLCPDVLQTMHIKGRLDEVPQSIVDTMDIYFYQSGHNSENRGMPYLLAESFYSKYPAKPIINSEPCYEQMGYSRREYGRWSQGDIRKAAWQSVLSGAGAGITYGAAGIYSWQRPGLSFIDAMGEGFDAPQNWHDALNFPGAWDYSYIRQLLELHAIEMIEPKQSLLVQTKPGLRVGVTGSYVLVYVPYSTRFSLHDHELLDIDSARIYDLSGLRVSHAEIEYSNNAYHFNQSMFLEDVIVIIKKEK